MENTSINEFETCKDKQANLNIIPHEVNAPVDVTVLNNTQTIDKIPIIEDVLPDKLECVNHIPVIDMMPDDNTQFEQFTENSNDYIPFLGDIPDTEFIIPKLKNNYYVIGDNHYPSVNSILKPLIESKFALWKKSVGEEAANSISEKEVSKENRMHKLCSMFLSNKDLKYFDDKDKNMFENTFVPFLNKLTNIKSIDQCLFSHHYKYAGTVDCIAEYDGVMAIVGFKTARKLKQTSYINHYFIEATAYSIAYEEMTGQIIDYLVVCVGVDGVEKPQIFTDSRTKWMPQFLELLNKSRDNLSLD